ncbi:MAG: hypothetical protein JNL80_06065 [Phycisphaerae bacterium]|jgi:hypothetical protein|nr:hypothetical protein [Phycisphaerae bacterium]
MMTTRLPRRSSSTERLVRSRGGAGTKILLVLSAIFLIVGIVGLVVARNAVMNDIFPTFEKIGKELKEGDGPKYVLSPGETKVDMAGAGGMIFLVSEKVEIEGKEYTYAPGGKLNITVTGPDGSPVKVEKIQGMQPIKVEGGSSVHPLAFAEVAGPGTYTIAADGQETPVYFFSLSGADWDAMISGVVKAFGGGLATCCGFPLFLLFGIIGGIILIFGKKPAPMP